jgi:peptidoglycan/xylan/chitin deacetylase (PgdA/CDA1 family)
VTRDAHVTRQRLMILAWHNVDRTWSYPCRAGAGAAGLDRQLRRLQRVATLVPLAPALEALGNGRPLPPRPVAVTFDDGYRDNLELGVPILERLGVPAIFFLVPGMLSAEVQPWWEVLGWAFARSRRSSVPWRGRQLHTGGARGRASYRWAAEQLKTLSRTDRDRMVEELVELLRPEGRADAERLLLDWDGARELVRRGFEVGSHSSYHAILSRELESEQACDLEASRRRLEAGLGVGVRLLAYPNGAKADYDERTVHAAVRAGYSHAVTVRPGWNLSSTPTHELRRIVLEPVPGFCRIGAQRVGGKLVRKVAAARPHRADGGG